MTVNKPNTKTRTVDTALDQQLKVLASVVQARRSLSNKLGATYDGQRDLYAALGYKKDPTFSDYYSRYCRQDIAKRIINAYPDATWRQHPEVLEDENPEVSTPFEQAWAEVRDKHSLFHQFSRVDKLAGIGRYAVLFLGFSDGGEVLEKEVTRSASLELLYVKPYSEKNAEINTWDKDRNSKRYGLPLTYKLRVQDKTKEATNSTSELIVHHSRVLHVAEGLLESEVYGTPRLESVLNRLDDLERIAGGSSEMFWRGGFPGISFEMDPEAEELSTEGKEQLDEAIDDYMHSMRRYIKLQGIKANSLAPQIADPSNHADLQLKLISGSTGIPVRILTGSERGELASTQDKENWTDRNEERRADFAEPVILRAFIDRLISLGVLPEADYKVRWPSISGTSEKDQAELGKTKAEALAKYLSADGDRIVPPQQFLTYFLGFEDEVATEMIDSLIDDMNTERDESAEAEETDDEDEDQ